MSQAQYQYTVQSEDLKELNTWAPRLMQKLRTLKELRDVNTDQQDRGLEANADDRSRYGFATGHHAAG